MRSIPTLQAHITISHLRDMTKEYGDGWGYPHVCRILQLIDEISKDLTFNQNITLYAAYLHDWGAFPHFAQASEVLFRGVDHALRSMQIAEKEILPHTHLSQDARQGVLDAIALHDYRDPRPAVAIETLLLREADMLDMLGVVGMAREFAWGPNDLRTCFERIQSRRMAIAGRFTIPRAQNLAEKRLASMDQAIQQLSEESFGFL